MPGLPSRSVALAGAALILSILSCDKRSDVMSPPPAAELDSPYLLGASSGSQNFIHVFANAGANAYWFLISSGWRTYRYLPLFFRDFYPRDASMKPLLDTIAFTKFGDAYDVRTGVIRLATPAPLREGVSDPEARMSNPHVRFFVEANPGHADGDELACLVRVGVDNLTPAGLRMIGRR